MSRSPSLALVAASAWLAVAAAGCGTPIDGVDHMTPRAGGGVTIIGDHADYDGLAEHENIAYVRIDLDDSGQVSSRDDISEQTADSFMTPVAPPLFADGTTLDVVPTVVPDPESELPGPQVVRGLDAHGNELWRTALPIERIAAQVADTSGARIVAGTPVQTVLEKSYHFGIIVLELTAQGAIVWQRALH